MLPVQLTNSEQVKVHLIKPLFWPDSTGSNRRVQFFAADLEELAQTLAWPACSLH